LSGIVPKLAGAIPVIISPLTLVWTGAEVFTMESVLPVFLVILIFNGLLLALPVIPKDENNTEASSEYLNETNRTAHDLYVIRTIVYEVGILTDADNDTDHSNETHEEVDLTFYDPKHNSSVIDLSKIPAPVQTNVSGEIITGIAPANFGTIPLKDNGIKTAGYLPLKAPIFPNILITQTRNASSSDPAEEKEILHDLPTELGI